LGKQISPELALKVKLAGKLLKEKDVAFEKQGA
jgi:hypothetical protein